MKPILFLGLILAAGAVKAQAFEVHIVERKDPNIEIVIRDPRTEARAVEDCANCSSNLSQVPQPIAGLHEIGAYLESLNQSAWDNDCRSFVKNGEVGVYGQKIRSEIMKPGRYMNIKSGDEDLAKLCPNYQSMSDSGKADVILLIMTAMAFEESSCSNETSDSGPNGTVKGFFQLHLGAESRYAPGCKNNDSLTANGSITCALSILDKQMGQGNMFRQDRNHWDVLRPQRWNKRTKTYFDNPSYASIREAVNQYPACQ